MPIFTQWLDFNPSATSSLNNLHSHHPKQIFINMSSLQVDSFQMFSLSIVIWGYLWVSRWKNGWFFLLFSDLFQNIWNASQTNRKAFSQEYISAWNGWFQALNKYTKKHKVIVIYYLPPFFIFFWSLYKGEQDNLTLAVWSLILIATEPEN